MNTSLVTLVSQDVSRVRFRWTLDQPELLPGVAESKYKSRLEVMEFNCSLNQYRPYHLTFYNEHGDIVRIEDSPGEWRAVTLGSMMEKLFLPGCELIKKKTQPAATGADKALTEKVARFAHTFAKDLEQAKDFKPVIEKFFVPKYLNGYLGDKGAEWFVNLSRDTAAKVSPQELQRFYVALMNAGYLSSLYVISQLPLDSEEPLSFEKLLPPYVLELVRNHPYTAKYKTHEGNYDFLAESIGSVERLRSYTDLLEKIGSLMRKQVRKVAAEHSQEYQAMLENWHLYDPKIRFCGENCLGLPKGTRMFEVNVPVFHLQIAEIAGTLKVVSARSSF